MREPVSSQPSFFPHAILADLRARSNEGEEEPFLDGPERFHRDVFKLVRHHVAAFCENLQLFEIGVRRVEFAGRHFAGR